MDVLDVSVLELFKRFRCRLTSLWNHSILFRSSGTCLFRSKPGKIHTDFRVNTDLEDFQSAALAVREEKQVFACS